ncbi:hypothetical protein ACFE04_000253 [Oxalis oulophora]
MERIRELDFEVEEVNDSEDDHHAAAYIRLRRHVIDDDISSINQCLLSGLVLFPQDTLPLRVIQPNFIAALDKALLNNFTIDVVRVSHNYTNRVQRLATVGTTAEIRQYRRLEDGSINVVTRGQQCFRLRRHWFDGEGVVRVTVLSDQTLFILNQFPRAGDIIFYFPQVLHANERANDSELGVVVACFKEMREMHGSSSQVVRLKREQQHSEFIMCGKVMEMDRGDFVMARESRKIKKI